MTAHTNITTAPIEDAFSALSDRDALHLFKMIGRRFSDAGYAFDDLSDAIDAIAESYALDEAWQGDDLAERYLAADINLPARLDAVADRRAAA